MTPAITPEQGTTPATTSGARLTGKVIILTGAAGNIGNYISRHLLREGARVVMTGRDGARLDTFIDTLVVCTLTSLVILLTGVWNREADIGFAEAPAIVAGVGSGQQDPGQQGWSHRSFLRPSGRPVFTSAPTASARPWVGSVCPVGQKS